MFSYVEMFSYVGYYEQCWNWHTKTGHFEILFFFSYKCPELGYLDDMVITYLTFWETFILFLQSLHMLILLTILYKISLLYVFINIVYLLCFYNVHSNRLEMIFFHTFDTHFPGDCEIKYPFINTLDIRVPAFNKFYWDAFLVTFYY